MLGRALTLIPSKLTSPSRDYCRPNLTCRASIRLRELTLESTGIWERSSTYSTRK